MKTGYIALFSALFISSVAIYFSVAGLAAIFSAYAISVIIMGSSIELGKLAGVVWLHHNWRNAIWWLKYGLITLIVGVMFITSMGIFGYLSKSHVEQTASSQENVAQVERTVQEIARHNAIIARSEQKIESYEDNGSGVDAGLNSQIDKEQERIDTAYDRVKPVIQVQLDIIATDETKTEARTKPYQEELDAINTQLADLQTALSNKQIKTAQGIVGTRPDGSYQSKTVKAIDEFRTRNEARRDVLLQKIDAIRGTPSAAASNAQQEINRIRASVQSEIDESNATIKALRSRMGKSNANDIETLITSERGKIAESNAELDTLIQDKFQMEASHRKLVAEVGPIKYIAEFVYGQEPDANLLEKAVTWLIILVIFVFDPFAVLLLIAAQHSFESHHAEQKAEHKLEIMEGTVDHLDKVIEDTNHLVEDTVVTAVEVEHELEETIEAAIEIEHELEELMEDEPEGFTEEDKEWLDMVPVGQEFGSDEFHFEDGTSADPLEPVMPPNEIVKEHEVTDFRDGNSISLTKTANDYVNFNGKNFRIDALQKTHPELNLNFNKEVRSGPDFPADHHLGMMFLRTDETPTQLYIANGTNWYKIDKNVLNHGAYSHEYIKALIKRVGNGEYNPELLNEAEKRHIEELLGRE